MRISCLLALCLLYSSCTSNDSQTKTNDGALPPVVATVNGQEIPTKLYEMYLKNGKEALALDPNTDEGRKKVDQLREGIVSELIDRALIAQETQRRGLTIAADKLATAEQRAIQQFGGEQKYDEYRMSFVFPALSITKSLSRNSMRIDAHRVGKDLSVSEKEISDYTKRTKASQTSNSPTCHGFSHSDRRARQPLERQLKEIRPVRRVIAQPSAKNRTTSPSRRRLAARPQAARISRAGPESSGITGRVRPREFGASHATRTQRF